MVDCGVSWLLRVQKSCGSPQTAVTTSLMLAQHLMASEMLSSALLHILLRVGGWPMIELGKRRFWGSDLDLRALAPIPLIHKGQGCAAVSPASPSMPTVPQRPGHPIQSSHWLSDRRKKPGCGHAALFGESWVGPMVAMVSA